MIKKASVRTWIARLVVAGVLGSAAGAAAAAADTLEFSLILTRHGIRSSLYKKEIMDPLAAQPWPEWEVAPGLLTPQGGELVALMGAYYREYYTANGLLSGDGAKDAPHVFFRADNDQRTLETARRIGLALLDGHAPLIVAPPDGVSDALFQPLRAHKIKADQKLGAAAVLGRIGGDPVLLERAYAKQFADLKKILYGEAGEPANSPFHEKGSVVEGEWDNLVKVNGPVRLALITTESLILEYVDGKPLPDVGWGRVDEPMLTELLALHELSFDLTARSFYPAQVQSSNLAEHILLTLRQAASGQTVPGSIGRAGDKIVVLAGHDTNIANMGGLLHLNWWLAGTQQNPVLPGGALTFELWRHGDDGKLYVRTTYVAQSLGQMRRREVLSLKNPPQRSAIFVPGYSTSGPGFDTPFEDFARAIEKAINPAFVVPGTP